MGNKSVNELSGIINQNKLNEALLKSEALLHVALYFEWGDVPSYILHDYLWVVSDFWLMLMNFG